MLPMAGRRARVCGEEEEQMERWLVFLAAALLIGVPIDLFRTYDMLELFARTMQALIRVACYRPGRNGAGTPIVTGVTLLPETWQG